MGSEESTEANHANRELNGDLNREHCEKVSERENSTKAETDEVGHNAEEDKDSSKPDANLRQRKGKKNIKNEKKNHRNDNLQKNSKPPKLAVKVSPKSQSSIVQILTTIPKWIYSVAFFLVVCVLAAVTRLWQLDRPPHIW